MNDRCRVFRRSWVPVVAFVALVIAVCSALTASGKDDKDEATSYHRNVKKMGHSLSHRLGVGGGLGVGLKLKTGKNPKSSRSFANRKSGGGGSSDLKSRHASAFAARQAADTATDTATATNVVISADSK